MHIEQLARLLIHATLRTTLERQLNALRWGERWGSTERGRNEAWMKRHKTRQQAPVVSPRVAADLDTPAREDAKAPDNGSGVGA